MTEEEINKLYTRIAFQYESALDQLVGKGLVDEDLADVSRKTFYNSLNEEKLRTSKKIRSYTEIIRHYKRCMISGGMVSLTELARNTQRILLGMPFKAGCGAAILWNSSVNGKMT